MENQSIKLILEKTNSYDYKTALFRLALAKENGIWKVMMGQIILNISDSTYEKILLNSENLTLVDISVPVEEFKKFVEYLGRVYIGDISPEGKPDVKEQHLFTLGNYKLCFIGNFPGNELNFYNRNIASKFHGIDHPLFLAGYAVHQSVAVKKRYNLDLTISDIPLRNVSEALNYFWNTHYEEHNLDSYCNIYLPTYEASISHGSFSGSKITLNFDIDESRVNLSDLSVAIIAIANEKSYRKKHPVEKKPLEIDFTFVPNEVSATLIHKLKKIDELNHYDYRPIQVQPRYVNKNEINLIQEDIYPKETGLFDNELISRLPNQVQSLLRESEKALENRLYRAAAILFRSAVEESITLVIKQIGKKDELYDDKFEVGLGKKIKMVADYNKAFNQIKNEMNDVKWFGDKASHEANMPINGQDIIGNLEPKLRLILTKVVEELKE